MLKYFRISANCVYPFPCNGETMYLRYAPVEEKGEQNWHAEVAFLAYLREKGYPCAEVVPSRNGNEIETVSTSEGSQLAVVFRRAPGTRLDRMKPTEDLIRKVGASLGRLHKLSSAYKPIEKPWGYDDILGWCSQELGKLDGQDGAMWEAVQLQEAMDDIQRPRSGYGFIHHDFEPDNLFVDEDGNVTPIDFEDCCINWFALDLDVAVNSLNDWLEEQDSKLKPLDARQAFLAGYKSEHPMPGHMWASLPLYRRFDRLCHYTRIVRCLNDKVQDPPDWMWDLRRKLDKKANELGTPYQIDNALLADDDFDFDD